MEYNENMNRSNRLQELGESDFEIADGQPDIRGWKVKTGQDETIGEVDELLFDAASRRVRYIILDLDGNSLGMEDDRKVLIPIGIAELHENDDDVILPSVTTEHVGTLPDYDGNEISRDMETGILNTFGTPGFSDRGADPATGNEDDFYNHGHFNQENLYRNRGGRTDTDEEGYLRSRNTNTGSGDTSTF